MFVLFSYRTYLAIFFQCTGIVFLVNLDEFVNLVGVSWSAQLGDNKTWNEQSVYKHYLYMNVAVMFTMLLNTFYSFDMAALLVFRVAILEMVI